MKHLSIADLNQNLSFAQFKGDTKQVEKIKKELNRRSKNFKKRISPFAVVKNYQWRYSC